MTIRALLLCAVVVSLAAPASRAEELAPPPLLAPLSAGEVVELPEVDPVLPSPPAFLGYPLGARFTRHADLRAYLAALDAASARVAAWDYGTTWLDRPLGLVAVSSAENIARLAELRADRELLADPGALPAAERERLAERLPAIVWLAYGVHGDEAASSEAAMAVAYLLAAARGPLADALARVVVLIDPLSNPDGRERYVAAYEQRGGRVADPDPAAAEHRQPWPGGRTNHYGFDLNRDWTWATQQETRARLAAVRAWEPQVYVDLHEMSPEETYFFPPSAEPVNPEIDPRVVRWLDTFGRSNAAAFDRLGWIYFKAESYDLFYPGYADSYLSFRGGVGMTYEAGGGGRAGLAYRRRDGSVLTLADRVARHLVSSLATVETAAAGARRLVADFVAVRVASTAGPGQLYLWEADRPEAAALAATLARHGVDVRRLARPARLPAARLAVPAGAAPGERGFPPGTWAVSSAQPLGRLVRALLEPHTPMSEDFLARQRHRLEQELDAAFYDVTAWSLPMAFNVEAWRAEGAEATASFAAAAAGPAAAAGATPAAAGEPAVGWLLPPAGLASYRAAARLQQAGVRFRVALDAAALDGTSYPAGTLFVPRLGNAPETAGLLRALAGEEEVTVTPVATSYASAGISLGSSRMADVGPVRLALVGGEGVRPTSFGDLWFLLDRQVEARPTRLDAASLGTVPLADFDVLLLPDGPGYAEALGEEGAQALAHWLEAGGLLVAVGDAVGFLRERRLTTVEEWQPADTGGDPESAPAAPGEPPEAGGRTLEERPLEVPGAVVATTVRAGHPLALGLAGAPPVLFTGSSPLLPTGEPAKDVLTVAEGEPVLAGFTWPESRPRLEGALLVATEPVERGRVVLFAEEPAFRGFWRGTFPLLLNAALFGPALFAAAD
jgi:hypothetical protein